MPVSIGGLESAAARSRRDPRSRSHTRGECPPGGDRIRVTAQLIDANSDSHLWSEGYDREFTLENILQIQEEIALAVVGALQVTLFTRASPSSSSDGPDNLAALDLYHEGMFFVRQIETGQAEHPSTFHQAIEKLEASIEAGPDWAPSHAALGEVYHFWQSPLRGAARSAGVAALTVLKREGVLSGGDQLAE